MSVRSFNFYCILVYLYCLYFFVMLWYVSGLWPFTTNKHIYICSSVCLSVYPSICLPGTDVHCDHTVHVSAHLSLRLDSPMYWVVPRHQSTSTYSQPSLYAWNAYEDGWEYRYTGTVFWRHILYSCQITFSGIAPANFTRRRRITWHVPSPSCNLEPSASLCKRRWRTFEQSL